MALACILIIHFNATVTGYFTLPHKLFASVLPLGIYLGDFGSSLFFMVSGAALGYTTAEDTPPAAFYKKRAKALYPMFWLAWVICFSIRFVSKPGYYAAAKTSSLVFTVLGLDTFAVSAGWVAQDFACVGEWFLGAILFLYLLFPLLQRMLRRRPGLTWLLALAVCLPVHRSGWDRQLVAVHLLEFLFGMSFLRLPQKARFAVPVVGAAFLALAWRWDAKITCALASAAAFVLLAWLARLLDRPPLRRAGAVVSRYSYPVFLVHHVIILRLAEQFDLTALTRRDTAFLFLIYLLATGAASAALNRLHRAAERALRAFRL